MKSIYDDPQMKVAIQLAERILNEMPEEPKGIKYSGFKRRATRASEYIANQPLAQAKIARLLNTPK